MGRFSILILNILLLFSTIFFESCEKHDFTDFYMVNFDANGGQGTMDSQQMLNCQDQKLNANKFVRGNYIFTGWNTQANGKGVSFADGQIINQDQNVTLYAQWADNAFVDYHFNINNVSLTMIAISGGTFQMGAQNSNPEAHNYDPDASEGEQPVHEAHVNDFWISSTEVTQALWLAVMDGQWPNSSMYPTSAYGLGDDYPMYFVSYEDANAFVSRLDAMLHSNGSIPFHRHLRLPSESEWEYAARGGASSQHYYYAGSNDANAVAWYENNANGYSHEVKTKQSNELGLYDMSGNVWEWCCSSYGNYAKGFVLRGGSWKENTDFQRVSCRMDSNGNLIGGNIGFRIVMVQD